jgi:hypothetical protein
MKLTPKLESFLTRQFIFYCKRMEVALPMILYRDEELGGMVENHKEFSQIKKGVLGESWHHKDTGLDFDVVYINVDNSDFMAQIIDTIIHELVHLKHPRLEHGDKFQQKINTIMMESI